MYTNLKLMFLKYQFSLIPIYILMYMKYVIYVMIYLSYIIKHIYTYTMTSSIGRSLVLTYDIKQSKQ